MKCIENCFLYISATFTSQAKKKQSDMSVLAQAVTWLFNNRSAFLCQVLTSIVLYVHYIHYNMSNVCRMAYKILTLTFKAMNCVLLRYIE